MINSRINLDNKSAVVLHYYNYKNSSLIVNFFLSGFGKVNAVAKGVKRRNSKQSQFALLQPFQKLNVSLTGKQELLILKSVEATPVNWKLSGKSLYCAYYLNELLLRLLPTHTDCSEIFSLYDNVLTILSPDLSTSDSQQPLINYEIPLRLFELKLLEFLGYGLNLSHETETGVPVDVKKQYYYILDSGPSMIKPCDDNFCLISGHTLYNLDNLKLSDKKTLHESKQLLKWALAGQLGDKPLKSREMFKQLYCS
ncbi:MAG: DNA repair protein RecO [gamma proteobacterium symbiont of Bathyaustriella thionipta]|nr:DNA repair protein RecO [gamma proteobacterium symbiont of Bathyaustriella thionipta]